MDHKTYRLLQLTDLHFTHLPSINTFFPITQNWKRIIGLLSLTVGRRLFRFDNNVQCNVLQQAIKHNPDLCIITGDISSTALHSEYQTAYNVLKPLLNHNNIHTTMLYGNHDAYTKQAAQQDTIREYFNKWMTSKHITIDNDTRNIQVNSYNSLQHTTVTSIDDAISVINLNPCRYSGIHSNGFYPAPQLNELRQLLTKQQHIEKHSDGNNKSTTSNFLSYAAAHTHIPSHHFIVIATHYPVLDQYGNDYGRLHHHHGVVNGYELIELLHDVDIKPHLIVHGHIHKGYHTVLKLNNSATTGDDGRCSIHHQKYIPIYNSGSSGQKYVKSVRSAAYNMYSISQHISTDIDSTALSSSLSTSSQHNHILGNWKLSVERYVYNGNEFHKEHTPYCTKY